MSRSSRSALRLGRRYPYQYTRGRSAFEVRCIGAEEEAEPRGVAGEDVGSGEETGTAETVPGTVHAPCRAPLV